MPGIGIDRVSFSPEKVDVADILRVRNEIGVGNDAPLFFMAAEFIPRKRHVDLLRALKNMSRQVHVAFAGVGEGLNSAIRLVREMGLGDRVHFLGQRRDIPVLIRSAAATILPSIQEGLSRSVMESMCLEVPVIGTDIRGISDLIKSGGGILVPVKSPEALKSAMEWILDNPEAAREMGRRGRQLSAQYDISHIMRLHENLYRELLSL